MQDERNAIRSAAMFVDHDNFLHCFGEAHDDVPRGWVPWSLLLRYATAELSASFAVKKAYGDFFSNTKSIFRERNWNPQSIREQVHRDTTAQQELLREGFELVLSPIYGKEAKNRADMLISLEIMALQQTYPQIETYCIVAGDSDFTPVAQRLRAAGRRVVIIGARKGLSSLLAASADQVIYADERMLDWGFQDPLRAAVQGWLEDAEIRRRLGKEGLPLEALGEAIQQRRPGFSPRWYDFQGLNALLQSDSDVDQLEWTVGDVEYKLDLSAPNVVRVVPATPAPTPAQDRLASQGATLDRVSILRKVLDRRRAPPRPELRHRIVDALKEILKDGAQLSLADMCEACGEHLSSSGSPVSKSKVVQCVSALCRAGAFLDPQGTRLYEDGTADSWAITLHIFLTRDVDSVRAALARFYVDVLRTDPTLSAEAPLGLDDAESVAQIVFGRTNASLVEFASDAIRTEVKVVPTIAPLDSATPDQANA